MNSVRLHGITLNYDSSESQSVELVRGACEKGLAVIRKCWGLEPPPGCAVYIMTSWLRFVFQSAPWHRRVLLALFFPLWCFKAMKVWKSAGGWVQGYGQAPAVGIKPPRLMASADRSVGDRLFVRDVDTEDEVREVTCHELTHACSNHLRLPTWLHEGLAMVSVDMLRGRPSVRSDTLDLIAAQSVKASLSGYPRSSLKDADAWICLYARGYWLTRYITDEHPELFPELLARRRPHRDIEEETASAFGLDHEEFWSGIDEVLVAHFKGERGTE